VDKVRATVTHARCLGELAECAIEIFKHAISGIEAIFGNELPNLPKVPKGAPTDVELLHR